MENQTQENQDADAPADAVPHLPEMNEVESSNIKAIGYDSTDSAAYVIFKDDSQWRFLSVPAALHTEWMKAESKGKFFHGHVKGQYESQTWDDELSAWSNPDRSEAESNASSAPTDVAQDTVHKPVADSNGNPHPMEAAAVGVSEGETQSPLEDSHAPVEAEQPAVSGVETKSVAVNLNIQVPADASKEAMEAWFKSCPWAKDGDAVEVAIEENAA